MENTTFRLTVLSGHLVGPGGVGSTDAKVTNQECAADSTISFARPAAPDCRFARPVSQAPIYAQFEALAAANESLRPCRPLSIPSSSAAQEQQQQDLPMFSRPVSGHNNSTGNDSSKPIQEKKQKTKTRISASGHWAPQYMLDQNEFGYTLQAVLPGVRAEDLRVEMTGKAKLVIFGIRHSQVVVPELFSTLPEVFNIEKQGKILEAGRFRVVWKLPKDANPDSVTAEFMNGCLAVKISKTMF